MQDLADQRRILFFIRRVAESCDTHRNAVLRFRRLLGIDQGQGQRLHLDSWLRVGSKRE